MESDYSNTDYDMDNSDHMEEEVQYVYPDGEESNSDDDGYYDDDEDDVIANIGDDEVRDNDDADEDEAEDEDEDEEDHFANHMDMFPLGTGVGSMRVAPNPGAINLQDLLGSLAQAQSRHHRGVNGNVNGNSNDNGSNTPPPGSFNDFISMFSNRMAREGGSGVRNTRMNKLVDNIANASDDTYIAMESLREVSENLLMTNQFLLDKIIPIDRLLTAVIDILKNPVLAPELELQLQACRCIYNLFEVNVESISNAVDADIIPILQEKIMEIDFIDLAEQVLETLEYISRIHNVDILRNGKLNVYLQFFDFFTVHAQRKAMHIVTNACTRVKQYDYDYILEVFPSMAEIFTNTTDSNIISRTLGAFTGICQGIKNTSELDSLFSPKLFDRVLQILANVDTDLEDKLMAVDILACLVMYSDNLLSHFLSRDDPIGEIVNCLQNHGKNPSSALNETLMFVPKRLLLGITKFITVLLPYEDNQILSIQRGFDKTEIANTNSTDFAKVFVGVTPVLVELYSNTTDYQMRLYILICLARIVSHVTEQSLFVVKKHIIPLLAVVISHFEGDDILSDKDESTTDQSNKDNTVLYAATFSIFNTLKNRFSNSISDSFRKEGIVMMIDSITKNLGLTMEDIADKELIFSAEDVIDGEDSDSENMSDSLDDTVPDFVKPYPIHFTIIKEQTNSLLQEYIKIALVNIQNYCGTIQELTVKEDNELNTIISQLQESDTDSMTPEESWSIWESLHDVIFGNNSEISGFELISTGLAKEIADFLSRTITAESVLKQSFEKVFADDAVKLVELLQNTLNRVESFPIIDCGLYGNEGGIQSLTKLIRLDLIIDEDNDEIVIPENLKKTQIQIHSIATFTNLKDFMKQRLMKIQFIDNMFPRFGQSTPATEGINESSTKELFKLENYKFSYEDTEIDMKETIIGAIFNIYQKKKKPMKEIWTQPQVIHIKLSKNSEQIEEVEETRNSGQLCQDKSSEKSDLIQDNQSALHILSILRFLSKCSIKRELFINTKLSSKLSRQLDEALVVISVRLPEWASLLTTEYPFLFPLETRIFALHIMSFSMNRLIQLWKSRIDGNKAISAHETLQHHGRVPRHKLRISRKDLFPTGLKVLDKFGGDSAVMEYAYIEEVGTGLGPTLEFYATMSKEFAKKSLKMWHSTSVAEKVTNTNEIDEIDNYVTTLLYPAPMVYQDSEKAKILDLFKQLGVLVARSLYDNRILDFRFNSIFFTLLHNLVRKVYNDALSTEPVHVYNLLSMLEEIDNQLAKSLKYIYDNRENKSMIEQLSVSYTLPGYNLELIDGGKNKFLDDATSVEKYISLVLDMFLGSGVTEQLEKFIEGFSRVFPYRNLLLFQPGELCDLFGRVQEDWSPQTLYSYLIADHGYTMDSSPVKDLISIMTEFDEQEKRVFLQFLTGSPKLPLGGFKALKPKFTVVLKHAEDGLHPDDYLPSVMTCANYLKLPKYSSKEIMVKKIMQAMQEGAGSFLLS
ncbi:Ubiquitin fusion degradation protein 4 [Nakaseomyces bracarensis]|uniref:HECT-type E3 ubiquitin transferase n=1 Tax=Nakaseomyces bracarensis TaxID=273131 RepID=A0ABR4NZD9_9SACH